MDGHNAFLKAGCLVVFSSGEYSDYGYHGSFVALQNVSAEEARMLVRSVKDEVAKDDRLYHNKHEIFISRCIRNGWLLGVDMDEIHLGSYGDLTPC